MRFFCTKKRYNNYQTDFKQVSRGALYKSIILQNSNLNLDSSSNSIHSYIPVFNNMIHILKLVLNQVVIVYLTSATSVFFFFG